jgi:ethanolamine ammonia-lyase large subunit
MLNYQSTSFHDALYVRELFGRKRAPEFDAWLLEVGLAGADGRLLPGPAALDRLASGWLAAP